MTWVELTSFNEVNKELFVLPLRYHVPYLWAFSLTLPALSNFKFSTFHHFWKNSNKKMKIWIWISLESRSLRATKSTGFIHQCLSTGGCRGIIAVLKTFWFMLTNTRNLMFAIYSTLFVYDTNLFQDSSGQAERTWHAAKHRKPRCMYLPLQVPPLRSLAEQIAKSGWAYLLSIKS